MTAKYLKYGSKASSVNEVNYIEPSYPPSPYLPFSNGNLSQNLSKTFLTDTSSDEEGISFTFPPQPPSPAAHQNQLRRTIKLFQQQKTPSFPPFLDDEEEDDEDDVFSYNPGFENFGNDDEDDIIKSPVISSPVTTSLDRQEEGRPSFRNTSFGSTSSSGKSKFQIARQFSIDMDSDEEDNGI